MEAQLQRSFRSRKPRGYAVEEGYSLKRKAGGESDKVSVLPVSHMDAYRRRYIKSAIRKCMQVKLECSERFRRRTRGLSLALRPWFP